MAEARKLAGRVSEESEVTPRRSFSLNIFLQEGERLNVLVPSWQVREGGGRVSARRNEKEAAQANNHSYKSTGASH